MVIFHGSDIAVPEPKIVTGNRLLDFGQGFYTTSSPEQAKRWARRVRERKNSKEQIISIYEFDISAAEKDLTIIRFDSPDHAWLHFVTDCRIGKESNIGYDIVMGPVANDKVYASIQLFETGLLSEAETIIRLKVEKIFDQILFHTEKSLNYCSYSRYETVKDEADG
ncbi:MAG: DUF3990 domain-containing protein [Treponema sp.]|jgi:hypothetical protein|nr:DUF3990 domain-containing protein [Treponema sp.]